VRQSLASSITDGEYCADAQPAFLEPLQQRERVGGGPGNPSGLPVSDPANLHRIMLGDGAASVTCRHRKGDLSVLANAEIVVERAVS